ncbi:MAG: riboflavin synthase subunit alpha [Cephaloticoccus sp.]|nr:riboflavin synthase subunit alpha [Cephaloticoccus sp.]MCF7761585.1 riboflavin synthase subunit alpha [Cephaloticoccus sp.]
MYTGIVQGKFEVTKVDRKPGLHTLHVQLGDALMEGLNHGSSVGVDGVCLTVAGIDGPHVRFDVMMETLNLTTLAGVEAGSRVNIERSAKAGAEIGGHPISGHVDTKAKIVSIERPENNCVMRFAVAPKWMRYVFSKGFLAVNGCSLTVVNADKAKGEFEVWLIPETLRLTTFGEKQPGDKVNIEVERQTQVIVDTISDLLKDPVFRREHGLG